MRILPKTMPRQFFPLALIATLLPGVLPCAPPARMPVYVVLVHSQDDYLDMSLSRLRLERSLNALAEVRAKYPASKPSLAIAFTGASSEQFQALNGADRRVDKLKEGVQTGQVEITYNGKYEPVPRTRPAPNFRTAKSGEDFWRARVEAFDWFLNDFKEFNFHTGYPDASRSGGLKRVTEVFGAVRYASGISDTLGGDPELDHVLMRMKQTPVLPGIPESDSWPARNVDGFRGGAPIFAREMAEAQNASFELYAQNHFLRLSDAGAPMVRRFSAGEGKDAIGKVLSSLDRSRVHVLQVEISGYGFHFKPAYAGGPAFHPLDHVFEFPRRTVIPDVYRRGGEETEAMYKNQAELLEWLSKDFFPANPDSRFVSLASLQEAASTLKGASISQERLQPAVKAFFDQWHINGTFAPPHQAIEGGYLSMADLFYLLTRSLAALDENGKLAPAVQLDPLFGPLEVGSDTPVSQGEVTVAEVAKECRRIAAGFDVPGWKPVPARAVPSAIQVGQLQLNSGQFLHLMTQAYLDPRPEKKLQVKLVYSVGSSSLNFPSTRRVIEQGTTWTVKPVVLRAFN
ncbi:MAG: hypothetical protein JNM66_31955 [Bryobacterales bacterium]|nr:hypothetical protein [Bryobacterales bacterium]